MTGATWLPHQLSIAETEDLSRKHRDTATSGILSKLDNAARACRQGISRAHLLDGSVNEALLTEIFSHEGFGTMVYSNEYQQIRRVFKKDVRGIMTLIRQSVDNEELVRRTRGEILEHLEDYWVLELDRQLVACVALHVFEDEAAGELACLYVSKHHENQGHGRKLMAFVETLARQKKLRTLFALSTQAYSYLQQKGRLRRSPGGDSSGRTADPLRHERSKQPRAAEKSRVGVREIIANAWRQGVIERFVKIC